MGHGCGYAGRGVGKNNPLMQNVSNVGPLPAGTYTIESPVDTETHGLYVLWLTPDPMNEMFGRTGFGIHGDSIDNPGNASEGCIVLPRITREAIWESGDRQLLVVPQ
jgi:hypothetical protein